MLRPEQIAFFRNTDTLSSKTLIDAETVDGWREQVWKHFNSSLETPETWPDDYTVENFSFSPVFGHLPVMQEIAEQLGGGQFFTGSGGSPSSNGRTPKKGGQCRKTDTSMPMVVLGVLLCWGQQPICMILNPRGVLSFSGPGSHHSTHKYFLEYPEQIDGSFYDIKDWGWQCFRIYRRRGPRIYRCCGGCCAVACISLSYRFIEREKRSSFWCLRALRSHTKGRDQIRNPRRSLEILGNLRRSIYERTDKRP